MVQKNIDLSRCLSIDLEVNKEDSRIQAVGAYRLDTAESFSYSGRRLNDALLKLDAVADGADFVLGHNIRHFDIPHLKAVKADLQLLNFPIVDTLYLSPLAFPRNPYHHLVKHYQDGALVSTQRNDPQADARLALSLFAEETKALSGVSEKYITAWHWLTTPDYDREDRALDALFTKLRKSSRPQAEKAVATIELLFQDTVCATERRRIIDFIRKESGSVQKFRWPLAFVLAWLSVAGGNSIMPPWVRHQFPDTRRMLRRLRDIACTDSQCDWCNEHHNAKRQLKRWFQFDNFRPRPVNDNGRSMQQCIVEESLAHNHVLGIMPTGTGKSVCYQVPALARYYNTGALTIVISPLVALMADQVDSLAKQGIDCCFTINSLLSMPERADALDKVRLGDAGILLISPEQLRSRSFRSVVKQREIGMWVLDEAHCLSRWGHDFRPDYRYVGRFIKESCGDQPVPPILCLTATAKPDVVEDIIGYFSNKIGIDLKVFNGGAERTNLEFEIIPTTADKKSSDVLLVLQSHLPQHQPGGAIVYCATRKQTEEIAEYLSAREVAANHFHAGLSPEQKKYVQREFISGEIRVITATNAFGMGIDKPDVRLIVHADIPGSLENYLQEAGRAGRDNESARCVLLYEGDDIEHQFAMSARSRLSQMEINGILRALRKLKSRNRFKEDVIATSGEILLEDDNEEFRRDSTTDDTRVRTAVSWLEEAQLLTREENIVQIFPSSLQIDTIEKAVKRLERANIYQPRRSQLQRIVEILLAADADEGVSTDELMNATKLNISELRKALADLEQLGIASNDMAITAYVHVKVKRPSKDRLKEASALEKALIDLLRESASDVSVNESWPLHFRVASQKLRDLKDEDLPNPLPERLQNLVRSISHDGRGEQDGGKGSLSVRRLDSETAIVILLRDWKDLEETARIRREAASCLLEHFIERLPPQSKGLDQLAETTFGELLGALKSDIALRSSVTNHQKLLDRALLWLHEQEIIRLHKGLTVLRPAMLIRVADKSSNKFSKDDFEPLALHYQGQVLQVHVMKEFAERGLASVSEALRMAMDYFSLREKQFLDRWLPDRELTRETTPESWQRIVENLNNKIQQKIVTDNRVQTNVLVLAGPGSGKTRVLVHRIAYLVRAKREDPRSIIALVYNRHAAVEIRRRLADLIGSDSRTVTVLTCHALAMRLVGITFSGMSEQPDQSMFQNVLIEAAKLLDGADSQDETQGDEQRERLLRGFRWMLVDEYQDIGAEEYRLISALAGRTRSDNSNKLTVFAVGDDDQNIYSFKGASVEFIRHFESDYKSKPTYLTSNYRSTRHIIYASNAVISPAGNRMKTDHPIKINQQRRKHPVGGQWETVDPVGRGRVQILLVGAPIANQTHAVVAELKRLSKCSDDWNWAKCAVIAREWKYLQPIFGLCEKHGIAVQMGDEEVPNFWRLRETQNFVDWLKKSQNKDIEITELFKWCKRRVTNRWIDAIVEAIDNYELETGLAKAPVDHFIEWLAEWSREYRRRQQGLLLVSAHRAKGLEFDHVAVLDGGWNRIESDEDADASRRQFYVAMTRATKTLTLVQSDQYHPFVNDLKDTASVLFREITADFADSSIPETRTMVLGLDEVDIGYAGRLYPKNRIHRAIAQLSAGDPLNVAVRNNGRFDLQDGNGQTVVRLANKFIPPKGMRCLRAHVFAVVRWNKEISDVKFQETAQCDSWEVIIPQLVFENVKSS